MGSRLPRRERSQLQVAWHVRGQLLAELDAHRKACLPCHANRYDPARWCEEGWQIGQSMARASARVRRLQAKQPPAPPTLF